jgi:hypothetical protein
MNLTPHYILISKIINRITVKINWFYRFLPVKWIVGKNAVRLLKGTNKACLQGNLKRILGSFQEFPETLKQSDDVKTIIEWADKTLRHEFDYLGSGLTKLDPIDWHVDFKSGFKWSKGKFYKSYKKVDLSNNADVKVPWELSRCHHLLWLGEAYLITKDEKYAKEVVDQIEWWIKENPLMYSINWSCAMDVAIRAVNWMFAVNMIIESISTSKEFVQKLYCSLYEHGFYIYNNLEKSIPYSANHYASNVVGLLYLGQLFIHNKCGRKWWNFSLNEYYSEIRMQILPTGVHHEKSISYHRLMTELFSYPVYMLHRVGVELPLDIIYRVQSMYNFIANYLKPNGNAPLVGDNDDGRFLPFVHYEFLKHSYLLNISSLDNQIISKGLIPLFKVNKNSNKKSILHNDAGFAIIRNGDAYLFVNNGGQSKYPGSRKKIGTHTHNDLLSFDFAIGEDDVLVDPGTYVYTSDIIKRNEFRSTIKHNTIIVDEEEQNILSTSNAFTIEKNSNVEKLTVTRTSTAEQCEGSYTTIAGQMSHFRQFNLESDKLIIHDRIKKTGETHLTCLIFHFAEDLLPSFEEGKIAIETKHFFLQIGIESSVNFDIKIDDNTISPSYGILKEAKTGEIKFHFNDFTEVKTIITWTKK